MAEAKCESDSLAYTRRMVECAKISVILPVYNVKPYIARCIESLRSQTMNELEFIFVDDCSTDGSMLAIEAWATADKRVRIIRNGENLGAGPSRNIGIEAACGDYLSFIDPDDYVSASFYELLYMAASADGGHDIAKGRHCLVDQGTGFIGPPNSAQDDSIYKSLEKREPLYLSFLNEHWTALWSKSLFENPEVRYGTSLTAQDTTFQLRACYQTDDIVFEPRALYYYVQRPDSATHRSEVERTYGELDSLDEKVSFLLDAGMDRYGVRYVCMRTDIYLRRFQRNLAKGILDRSQIPGVLARFSQILAKVNAHAKKCGEEAELEFRVLRILQLLSYIQLPADKRFRISVIVPVYDVEPCIGRCIESLRAQLMDGLEFIFVDDCSTDGSMAAVEAWAEEDSRVRIIRNGENLGAGPSHNRGIEAARGDYLSFVDPNDYVSLDFYELLYAAATSDGGHDIAKGLQKILYASGKRTDSPSRQLNKRIVEAREASKPLCTAFSGEYAAAIYRRSLFEGIACNGTTRIAQNMTFLLATTLQTDDIVIAEDAVYHHAERQDLTGAESWIDFIREGQASRIPYIDGCAAAVADAIWLAAANGGASGFRDAYLWLMRRLNSLPARSRAAIVLKVHRRLANRNNLRAALKRIARRGEG